MKIKVFLLFLIIFITYIPIFSIIMKSFYLEETSKLQIFTLILYKRIFYNTELLNAISNSLIISLFTSLISSILGVSSAISLEFYDNKLKHFFRILLQVPIYFPDISLAVILGIFYSYLSIKKSYITLVISQCIFATSLIHFLIRISLKNFDKNIIKASFDYGANPSNVLFEIILPQIKKNILVSIFFTFILSFTDFNYSLFTSGPGCTTFTTYIYSSIRFNLPGEIYAVFSIIFLFIIIFIFFLLYYILKKEMRITIP